MNDIIGLDIETYDKNLKKMGPGEVRGDGEILGVGYKSKTRWSIKGYASLNSKQMIVALKSTVPKVCHNASYDVPWLQSKGITVNGKVHDTMIAGALLDEHSRSFSLDAMVNEYLGERKGDDEIARYAVENGWTGAPQGHLQKMPRGLVGRYCNIDVDQTMRLLDVLLPEIDSQGLRDIYEIEIGLFPLMWQMRRTGIRMDDAALQRLRVDLEKDLKTKHGEFIHEYGDFNIRSGKQIATVLDAMGIPYDLTEKFNPKLGKAELAKIPGVGTGIIAVRELSTLLGNFVNGAFPKYMINGRLHTQFLQTKRDDGGTVSGRFSARHPNLTQVPVRHPIWGQRFRELFLPEEGMDMLALDYDGIESRIFAHYAIGGDAIRQAYNDNPDMDYHQVVADMAGIERREAKTINFAALYGAGVAKITEQLGATRIQGRVILDRYHKKFPAVKKTMASVERAVRMKGYISTVGGRRARITPQQARERKYYLFLNRLIQGSAADLLKKGMLDAYNAGVFDYIVPHLLVHDEIVASVPKGKAANEAVEELKRCMEHAYLFNVPIRVSGGRGKNWNEAH